MAVRNLLLLWAVLLSSAASGGVVRTLDGKVYEGQVELRADGTLGVISERGEPAVTVRMEDVLHADLRTPQTQEIKPTGRGEMPQGWAAGDIGRSTQKSSVSYIDETFVIKAGGHDISGQADSFCYVSRELEGDGQIVARLTGFAAKDKRAKAGLMIRSSTSAEAANLMVLVHQGGGAGTQHRAADRGPTSLLHAGEAKAPIWLRIVRRGNTVLSYRSRDGVEWDLLASEEMRLPRGMRVGLAVCGQGSREMATATFDKVAVTAGATAGPAARITSGVVLRNGTVLAGGVRGGDETSIRLQNRTISTNTVSHVVFRPVTADLEAKIAAGRSGVLLANGDFLEGKLRSFEEKGVKISSVLFGVRRFGAGDGLVALVLAPVQPVPSTIEVTTLDGSTYQAKGIKAQKDGLEIEDTQLGAVKIASREVAELRIGSVRMQSLCEVRPAQVTGQGLIKGVEELGVWGSAQALVAKADTELQFELDGGAVALRARVGVPARILPAVGVRFVVVGDGRELLRSAPMTSLDEPVELTVQIAKVRRLGLRVEAVDAPEAGAAGYWSDPAVIR